MNISWSDITIVDKKPLGVGGFGTIYRATCRGAPVALKILHNAVSIDALRHEIEVMSKLNHPNVVVWMGVVHGEKTGILMALEKKSLEEVLYRSQPLSALKKWKFSLDICKGMCSLAKRNIFHRDLKPENILLSEAEDCKISDFGLSMSMDYVDFVSNEFPVGSRLWMSPEVLSRKCKVVNNKADIYSFSLIVWQIFTQEHLFKEYLEMPDYHIAVQTLTTDVINGKRPSFRDSIPQEVWMIINKGWAHDPTVRPTFEELQQSLGDALYEEYLKEFPEGMRFWRENFPATVFVPWTELYEKLKARCVCASSIKETILKEYFGVVPDNPRVSIEKFRHFLCWFEDLRVSPTNPLCLLPFQILHEALHLHWLGGLIDTPTAATRLALAPNQDSFIVRVNAGLSGSLPFRNPFQICCRKANGITFQLRILYDPAEGEFKITDEKGGLNVYKRVSITHLIPQLQRNGVLAGAPIGELLGIPQFGGYL